MSNRRYAGCAAALSFFLGGLTGWAMAADNPQSKTVQGLMIDYGIVPAAIVKGHPLTHVEGSMHGGVPKGQHAETFFERPMHGAAPLNKSSGSASTYQPAQVNRAMGGPPPSGPQYHLVVAIFDASTGARVSNASVEAEIFPLNLSGTMMKLETMQIAGTATYGGFFRTPDAHHYTIRLTIHLATRRRPIVVTFEYGHA